MVGDLVGLFVGDLLGVFVGDLVGLFVGDLVGHFSEQRKVGWLHPTRETMLPSLHSQ